TPGHGPECWFHVGPEDKALHPESQQGNAQEVAKAVWAFVCKDVCRNSKTAIKIGSAAIETAMRIREKQSRQEESCAPQPEFVNNAYDLALQRVQELQVSTGLLLKCHPT